jgi:hypothetical protein
MSGECWCALGGEFLMLIDGIFRSICDFCYFEWGRDDDDDDDERG